MSFSRRDFLKITALAGAAVGLSATAARHLLNLGQINKVAETHALMGTLVNFVVVAETQAQARSAIQTTVAGMRRLIQVCDYRLADSLLGQLNATGHLSEPPSELVSVLRQARHFSVLSQGAFDITVKPLVDALRAERPVTPSLRDLVDYRLLTVAEAEISLACPGMAVTLDGIAKGRVVDQGVALFRQQGFETILVEAGGDLLAQNAPGDESWKVGIAHPRAQNQMIATVSVRNQAVATSGDYLNHFSVDYSACHILDPRTGRSPTELSSATVLAPSVADADALSTALMVLGRQAGLALIESLPDTAALLISKDLQLYRSSKFPVA